MNARANVREHVGAQPDGTVAVSKDGYPFDPFDRHWKLNKDVTVSTALPSNFDAQVADGFRQTLRRYAEEMSAKHAHNMSSRFQKFVADTQATTVTAAGLLNWRASLGSSKEWQLGGLKGFLIAWHDYGYPGIPKDVVDLLEGWRIKGNEKGAAVAMGCPETGPFTDLEMGSLLDWSNMAVVNRTISFEDYAYLQVLALTARRSVQIAALRGKDLIPPANGDSFFTLNIPRAKQRRGSFRRESRSLPIPEDFALILKEQHRRSVEQIQRRLGYDVRELSKEVPIFLSVKDLEDGTDLQTLKGLLMGSTPDFLHATTIQLDQMLARIAAACTALSERTGKPLHLNATRFRYTRGTNLRREGFGVEIIADLLDHSDTQNAIVYVANTPQEAVTIDQIMAPVLAPFAQACLGTLVRSERDAIRGEDPRSRVPNDRQEAIGTCGNYGFCADGYRACYTCVHFQPWLDAPHGEVLEDLYAEKQRAKDAGCSDVVVNANDLLILAVEHCLSMCDDMRAKVGPQLDGAIA